MSSSEERSVSSVPYQVNRDVGPAERSSWGPGGRQKRIVALELSRFDAPNIPGNRSLAWRSAWYLVNALLFDSALVGLLPSFVKSRILRAFGAKIGRGLVCKPRVSIKYPWFLEIGDHVWLGERIWIDNHCLVRIGSNSCISQGAYVFTGNHDWTDPKFAFFSQPIEIGEGVWVTAFAKIGPGTRIPDHTVYFA